jgi:hypothetical protein
MTGQRLIEDYIPIEAISAEARRGKSIRNLGAEMIRSDADGTVGGL